MGCHNAEQQAFIKQKLHKMFTIDTGGLPYELIFVVEKYYMLTTNIDVYDGLANGGVEKLCYIDYDINHEISRIWLIFPNPEKIRSKVSGYMSDHNIIKNAAPITRRPCTISLNNNKSINAKQTWINNEENIDVLNFYCIAKIRRHNHRAGGVVIFKNKEDMTTYVTLERDVALNTTESFGFNESCFGEMLCSEICRVENGEIILMGPRAALNLRATLHGTALFIGSNAAVQDENEISSVAHYLPKILIAFVPFKLADTGHPVGATNVL
ncbi:ATP-dependent DNA helicase [Trichonephila clavipes]|nr:ATP-dependent DNA helicase [Trichonephila clavipes]